MNLPPHPFDAVLGGLARETFLREQWGRAFMHLPGPTGRFSDLLSWEELSEILASRAVKLEKVRMYRDGASLPRERFIVSGHLGEQLSAGSVRSQMAEGATLIIDSVEDYAPTVRELARGFEDVLRSDTVVNLYVASGREKGFDLHWDRQDTFILQVCGTKDWQVFPPTRMHPLADDVAVAKRPIGEPVWAGRLQEGEALYLPRGWWHVALPTGEPTMHLTVTVVPSAGPDFLDWFVRQLKRHPIVRANLPIWGTREARVAHSRALRDLVGQVWDDDLMEQFLAQWDADIFPLQDFDLPARAASVGPALDAQSVVRLLSSRRLAVSGRDDRVIRFHANGVDWECAVSYEPALQLLKKEGVLIGDLLIAIGADGGANGFLAFLMTLQMGGVIRVMQG
jgi:ribosomal protein L16 Arg81 hydroxylase